MTDSEWSFISSYLIILLSPQQSTLKLVSDTNLPLRAALSLSYHTSPCYKHYLRHEHQHLEVIQFHLTIPYATASVLFFINLFCGFLFSLQLLMLNENKKNELCPDISDEPSCIYSSCIVEQTFTNLTFRQDTCRGIDDLYVPAGIGQCYI